jgi:uncharacterized membrane protein YqiK
LLIALIATGFAFQQTNLLAEEKSISDMRRIEAEQANSTSQAARATAEARRVDAEHANSTAEARRVDAERANSTAEAERDRAESQAEISLARQLAAQAQDLLNTQSNLLPRAALLSNESLRRYPEIVGYQALADALQILPKPPGMTHNGGVLSRPSADGVGGLSSIDGTACVWEASSGGKSPMTHDIG